MTYTYGSVKGAARGAEDGDLSWRLANRGRPPMMVR